MGPKVVASPVRTGLRGVPTRPSGIAGPGHTNAARRRRSWTAIGACVDQRFSTNPIFFMPVQHPASGFIPDPPGYGRGGSRGGGRPYTGINDGDPNDPPGRGRGGYRGGRGVTDSDPYDAPGRGRGWR